MNQIDYSSYFTDPQEAALIRAVMRGDNATVVEMAKTGVNFNAVGQFENTPMRVAVKIGHRETVALLLKLGVDPNFKTPRGAAAAFTAVESKDPEVLRLFLQNGLNVNLTVNGEPLLFAALRAGNWPQYNALIQAGAEKSARTNNNTGLVQELISLGQYDRAKELIIEGIDVKTPNNAGTTVLEILVSQQTNLCADPTHPACLKRAELLLLLRERGVPVPLGLPGMNGQNSP